MEPLTTISTILTSLKTATDIASFFRTTDIDFTEADFKLQIADLLLSLADVKASMAYLKEIVEEKQQRINELEDIVHKIDTLNYKEELYYQEGDLQPFCPRCFEADKKAIHLLHTGFGRIGNKWRCPECTQLY